MNFFIPRSNIENKKCKTVKFNNKGQDETPYTSTFDVTETVSNYIQS
jgi:hypothetical protein